MRDGRMAFRFRRGVRLIAATGGLLLTANLCGALPHPFSLVQTNGVARESSEVSHNGDECAQLRTKREEARSEFNRVQTEMGGTTHLPPGATLAESIEYRSCLQWLGQIYQAHLDNLAAIESNRQRKEAFEHTAETWTGFADPPPYSILFVDDLRDTLRSLEDKIEFAESSLNFVNQLSANAETSMKEADGQLRRVNEQLEGAPDQTLAVRLNWLRELAEIRSRMAAAQVASWRTVSRMKTEEISECRAKQTFTQRQLALASQHTRFSREDLDKALGNLQAEHKRLDAELQAAYGATETRRAALAEARSGFQRQLQSSEQKLSADDIRRLQGEIDLLDIQAQTSAERATSLRQLVDGITLDGQLWQMRFAIFTSHNVSELQNAYRQLTKLSDLAWAAKMYFSRQVSLTASQVIEEQNRLTNLTDAKPEEDLIRKRLESLQERAILYRRVLENYEKREQLILRWKESIAWDRQKLPFLSRVRDLFTETTGFATKLWNFELVVVEDTITVDGETVKGHRGVTVGKIVIVLLILVVGYALSSLLSRTMQRLISWRLKTDPNQARLVRRWVHIILMTGVVIFALTLVKIPLTVFAFAGGALAIGVGFGTQNLIKNFISGVIILFERPFRVGDVLDIDGRRGTVTGIGIRSSVVQFWDGTETLIPNSSLLENNLTNWTYSNRTVRFSVTIGVAYGTDTSLVVRLLTEMATHHGLILKTPVPQVLFTDFGDSNLTFELRFWVDVSRHNAAQVSSDLRHMIAKAFAEHGVEMAYPQRDLHMKVARPIPVRIVEPQTDTEPPAEPQSRTESERSGQP